MRPAASLAAAEALHARADGSVNDFSRCEDESAREPAFRCQHDRGTPLSDSHWRMDLGDNTVSSCYRARGSSWELAFHLASDGECGGTTRFDGFSLSINAGSDAEAKKMFDALAKGGQVRMPLAKTFWTSSFGMLTDKFGVGWMVSVEHK
jgi:uncharacterized glyoxalase superfamily protein PhnB